MAKRAKVCIDRIRPPKLHQHMPTMRRSDGRVRAINPVGTKWINGSTLRVRFLGGSTIEQAIAKEQADWWAQVANIRFEFNNALNAELRIAFNQDDGAWSYIGTESSEIPFDQPTMNLGFLDGGTAAHEFGHALGLAHEHQNPSRGIQWNEDVVIREAAKSPNFWDEETTRHNIIRRYSVDQINGTDFDPDSIMLYFFPGSWTVTGEGTKANDVLSQMDRTFIAGKKMYPKLAAAAIEAINLDVNATKPTEASIGKFGEEDLFSFQVESDGRYIIDTQGETNVVMKLFGPNSQTSLIAEDDDSGFKTNARIAANLVQGKYFVQVRHADPEAGQGKYSLRVRRN